MTRSQARLGFTLLEMLVVVLIMGLCVGLVAAITHPDDRALLRVEAERLALLLDLAAEQSRLSGKTISFVADESSYRFAQFNDDIGWSQMGDGDMLRARTLPRNMLISGLRVENIGTQGAMRLEFYPYGTTLSYAVDMALGAERYAVVANPVGDVRALPGTGNPDGGMVLR